VKKHVPKEFLKEYDARRKDLQYSLEQIVSLLRVRLSQLAARKGVRARITDSRVKRPAKLWRRAQEAGLGVEEAFTKVKDILGIRIVCNNLSDVQALIEMIHTEGGYLSIKEVKDMVADPSPSGYRATHVLTEVSGPHAPGGIPTPCEVQIRTLAQDAWARISRADLYDKQVPASIEKLTQALSKQLSGIDEIAQHIREELTKLPPTADSIEDSDSILPQKLALLFKQKYKEELFEFTLMSWVQALEEAETENIGEVRAILEDAKLKDILDRIARRIRNYALEDSEWALYSAVVASEISRKEGIRVVKKLMQDEWDEITAIARSQVMPATIEEFVEDLRDGSLPLRECLSVLDCFDSCAVCGEEIFIGTGYAVETILEYYEKQDDVWGLEDRIDSWRFDTGYLDGGTLCDYCEYKWDKLMKE